MLVCNNHKDPKTHLSKTGLLRKVTFLMLSDDMGKEKENTDVLGGCQLNYFRIKLN